MFAGGYHLVCRACGGSFEAHRRDADGVGSNRRKCERLAADAGGLSCHSADCPELRPALVVLLAAFAGLAVKLFDAASGL
jgi:hypothetical protein